MFGDFIHPNIQRTLFQRIDALNRQGGVYLGSATDSVSDYSNLTQQENILSNTCWAKAISAVPNLERDSNGDIIDVKSTELFELSSYVKGNEFEPALSIRKNDSDKLFRPHNGITSIESSYLNQTTLSTTITWTLGDINEFEIYQNAFLTIGRMVMVEFGWSAEKPQEISTAETSEEMLDFFKANQKKIVEYGGDYFVTCGTIKNFNFNLSEAGRYECSTEIVSMGQQLFKSPIGRNDDIETPSLVFDYQTKEQKRIQAGVNKAIQNVESNRVLVDKEKEKLKEAIKEAQKTSFEKIMSDFNGHIMRVPSATTIEKIIKNFDWFPPYKSESEEESNDKSKSYLNTDGQIHIRGSKGWCTWGWFEDNILNTHFGLILPKSGKNEKTGVDDKWIARFNSSFKSLDFDGYEPNLCKSDINLFTKSFDIIFPGKTIEFDKNVYEKTKETGKRGLDKYEEVIEVYSSINRRFNKFEPDIFQNERGIIRNIVFSADILQKYFTGTSDIGSSIKAFWAYVSAQYGGFWDFDVLQGTNDTTLVGVFDRKVTRKRVKEVLTFPDTRNKSTRSNSDKSFEFSVYSKDSLLKELTFSTSISAEMMTQAALTGQNSAEVRSGVYGDIQKDMDSQQMQVFAALQSYNYVSKKVQNAEIDALKLQRDELLGDVTTPYMNGQVAFRDKTGDLKVKTAPITQRATQKTNEQLAVIGALDDEDETEKYQWFDTTKSLNERGVIYNPDGTMLPQYTKTMDYFINKTDKSFRLNDIPIPFTCTFSLSGIAGIKLYDYFTIDYIPELYREFAVFQVTSVAHTVGTDGWNTQIEAMMRVNTDDLAEKTGYEILDKVKDQIQYIDGLKFVEVINELSDDVEEQDKIETETGGFQTKAGESANTAENRKVYKDWNDEQKDKIPELVDKLYNAMAGGGTREKEVYRVFEHAMYWEPKKYNFKSFLGKDEKRIILSADIRQEITKQFNKKYGTKKRPTLEKWFKKEFSFGEEKRVLRYLK